MPRLFRTLVIVLACVCTACVTQGFAPVSAGDTRQLRIAVGTDIRVVTTERERLSIRVTEVLPDRLVGITRDPTWKDTRPAGLRMEIPYSSLAIVEVTRFDRRTALKTGAAVVIFVGLLSTVVGAIPIAVPPP